MKHDNPQSSGFRGVAMIAAAIGAVAVGSFAIGALAIGRLAIKRLAIDSAKLKSLEIENLSVRRLHAAEVTVSDSLQFPESDRAREIASRRAGWHQIASQISRRKSCRENPAWAGVAALAAAAAG